MYTFPILLNWIFDLGVAMDLFTVYEFWMSVFAYTAQEWSNRTVAEHTCSKM